MSNEVVLLIEDDDRERIKLRQALQGHGMKVHEVREAVHALGVIGRTPCDAIVASAGKRQLSLRGLFQLALRHQPDIVMLCRAATGSGPALREKLGVDTQVVPKGASADDVARVVVDLFHRRARGELGAFDEPTLTEGIDLEQAYDEEEELDVDVDLAFEGERTEEVRAPDFAEPTRTLFGGVLAPEAGASVLIGLFAQELTGWLELAEGPARGKLFFLEGSPVAAEPFEGDEAIRRRLVDKGVIPSLLPLPPLEGTLLSSLLSNGYADEKVIDDLQRDLVREGVLALVAQEHGAYRFIEDGSFLTDKPLHKVNPFGLVLEARRRRTPPADLMSRASDLAEKVLVPQPLLPMAARKLRPFVRDHDLAEILARPRTVREMQEEAGLDDLMGTLVAMTLVDARLVELVHVLPPLELVLPGTAGTRDPALSFPESLPVADDEDPVGDQILSLYVRLKPLTRPEDILGVTPGADADAARLSYIELMSQLDPARLSVGDHHRLLRTRVVELREKVARAFRELSP